MVLFVLFFFSSAPNSVNVKRRFYSLLLFSLALTFSTKCVHALSLALPRDYCLQVKKVEPKAVLRLITFFFLLLHRYRSQHRRGFQRSVAVHTRTHNFFFLFYTLLDLLFFSFDSLLAFLLDSSIFFFFFFLPLKVLDRNRTTRQALSQLRFFVECLSCSGSLSPFYACLKLLLEKRTASNAVLHLHS